MNLSKRQKIALVIVLVVAAAGVLTGGVYYTWLITPPDPPKTAAEGVKTMGSARFARMPEYRKTAYIEQTRALISQLPQDQRREFFHQMRDNDAARREMGRAFEAQMMKQMIDYAKASPADRVKILDAAIDREEQMRRNRGGGRPPGPRQQGGAGAANAAGPGPGGPPAGGGPGGRGGNFRARMQQRIEHGNPQRAALMFEFRRAMQQRRAERGLTTPTRGR